MYIIIVGGGKVGYYLAKQLVEDGHEVLIIEKDAARCERISAELGDIALRGDGCEAPPWGPPAPGAPTWSLP